MGVVYGEDTRLVSDGYELNISQIHVSFSVWEFLSLCARVDAELVYIGCVRDLKNESCWPSMMSVHIYLYKDLFPFSKKTHSLAIINTDRLRLRRK